jgi:hypothetical protein
MNRTKPSYTIVRTVKQTISSITGEILENTTLTCTPLKIVFKALNFHFDSNGNNRFYNRALRLKRNGMGLEELIAKIVKDKTQEENK